MVRELFRRYLCLQDLNGRSFGYAGSIISIHGYVVGSMTVQTADVYRMIMKLVIQYLIMGIKCIGSH